MIRPPLRVGLLALALLVVTALSVTPSASAVDHSRGTPGHCRDDTGVTVVIDFQDLGGSAIVRCFPSTTRGTGLDALQGAGFQVDGAQRWGLSFICRIENRPSAVEPLAIAGNEEYRERCIDTPPASGYWSYWHAGNNCAWKYSQWGVKNRDFVPGGFEGWSFSLNASADDNPQPRIAPVRPGTAGQRCVERAEVAPTTKDPGEQQSAPDRGSDTDDEGAEVGDAPSAPDPDRGNSADREGLPQALPPDRQPSEPAPDPADDIEFTDGEESADVRDLVQDQANTSDLAPWVAAGVAVLLGILALLTSRRRRRAQDGR